LPTPSRERSARRNRRREIARLVERPGGEQSVDVDRSTAVRIETPDEVRRDAVGVGQRRGELLLPGRTNDGSWRRDRHPASRRRGLEAVAEQVAQ
jgi:hypothetical protein